MNNLAYSEAMFTSSHHSSISQLQNVKEIKVTALNYLARREYSRLELFRKLSQKYSSGDNIQQVLDELQDQGYQSDDRFTESFIRSKVNIGDGPFKIKIALRERGVCESTVLSVFDRQKIDWLAVAERVKNKRFASISANIDSIDPSYEQETTEDQYQDLMKLRAKKIRYLKNKGFYQEHIDEVIQD